MRCLWGRSLVRAAKRLALSPSDLADLLIGGTALAKEHGAELPALQTRLADVVLFLEVMPCPQMDQGSDDSQRGEE